MTISDWIADVIRKTLEDSEGTIQIKRNELANELGCVPSQINYVIASRFTPEQGYIVESKRGGGGYIRIIKIQSDSNTLMHLVNSIGTDIDEHSVRMIIKNLCFDNILTQEQATIMLSAVTDAVLKQIAPPQRGQVRSTIFKSMLINAIPH